MWWAIGIIGGGLLLVVIIFLAYICIKHAIDRRHTERYGRPTLGWVVMANNDLYEKGQMDLPAMVLISPDEATSKDVAFMSALAERIFALKTGKACTKEERFVASLVRDERYIQGQRDKLPLAFTAGRTVYAAHLYVLRDHLPHGLIDTPYLHVLVDWQDDTSMICTRPVPKKKKLKRTR